MAKYKCMQIERVQCKAYIFGANSVYYGFAGSLNDFCIAQHKIPNGFSLFRMLESTLTLLSTSKNIIRRGFCFLFFCYVLLKYVVVAVTTLTECDYTLFSSCQFDSHCVNKMLRDSLLSLRIFLSFKFR